MTTSTPLRQERGHHQRRQVRIVSIARVWRGLPAGVKQGLPAARWSTLYGLFPVKSLPPMNNDYEKLGAFYLGKVFDAAAGKLSDEPLLYDSRDLTTHAVCVGMTGSGKTGLCLALLEEAAIDG